MARPLRAALLISAAAGALGVDHANLVGPLSIAPDVDCTMRQLAYNYSLHLLPQRAPLLEVFDALRLAVDCGAAQPAGAPAAPLASTEASLRGAAAAAQYYADPVHGSDSNAGTLSAPFATVQRAVEAARAGPSPATITLRNGTFFFSAPLSLGAQDSGLTIAAYPGESPVLSGAAQLRNLSWSPYNLNNSISGPIADMTLLNNCVDAPGQNSSHCVSAGTAPDADTCKARCAASAECDGYTWHDQQQGQWALACYFVVDGIYTPASLVGHYSGWKTNLNVWVATVEPLPYPALSLFVNNRRAVRGRYPDANPEEQQSPIGYMDAAGWLPPRSAPPPREVHIQSPSRPWDSYFPNFQWGVDGTVWQFSPPESFWGTRSPPAGDQYKTPSGLRYDPASFSPRVASWSNPTEAIVHAFHSGYWGDWAFEVSGVDANASTITFGAGGWQEARGSGSGGGFYVENVLEEVDTAGEYYLDQTGLLYYAANGTAGTAPDAAMEFLATQLETLVYIAGADTSPATDISLVGLTFAHTSPTFMRPFTAGAGGDWSFSRTGTVVLQGTSNTVVSDCTFWSPGGNGLIVLDWNRGASITGNEFAYTGESAIVSAGSTRFIDGLDANVPAGTTITGNLFRELGIFVKQAGAYYHGVSANATVTGNVAFNMPRAGININDGYAGGHLISSNLIFNAVRETSDHGCFNSWDRQPMQWDPSDASRVTPAPTHITSNFFVSNYRSTWPIDHDDGSQQYVDTSNFLLWGGSKNYLGNSLHSVGNAYVYADYSPATAAGVTPRLGNGADKCGFSVNPVVNASLADLWANNTCIVSTSSNVYGFNNCNPNAPLGGAQPVTSGNTLLADSGGYTLSCGSITYTSVAAAQAAGFDLGSTFAQTPADVLDLLVSMAHEKLQW